jgi:predicted metal-dependent HD superfamily phosphohydrolase
MINEGLVKENSSYIQGGRQHQKVYFLTGKGREAAGWMHDNTNNSRQQSNQTKSASGNTTWTTTKISAASLKKTRRIM